MNGENEPIPNAAELFLEQTLPVVQEYYVSDAELRHLYRAGITTTGAGAAISGMRSTVRPACSTVWKASM